MGAVRDLAQNMEIIAGTGDQCVPGDRKKCGDGGPAINADLFYPKGKRQYRVWDHILVGAVGEVRM